jgi:hypothetical protein
MPIDIPKARAVGKFSTAIAALLRNSKILPARSGPAAA